MTNNINQHAVQTLRIISHRDQRVIIAGRAALAYLTEVLFNPGRPCDHPSVSDKMVAPVRNCGADLSFHTSKYFAAFALPRYMSLLHTLTGQQMAVDGA
jgi:hypothetical protein